MHHAFINSLDQTKSACLVIGVLDDDSMTHLPINPSLQTLIAASQAKLIKPGDTVHRVHDQTQIELLLIHLGPKKNYTPSVLKAHIDKIIHIMIDQRTQSATLVLPQLDQYAPNWQLEYMLIQSEESAYQFLKFKTQDQSEHALKSIEWYLPDAHQTALHTGSIIADSIGYTRNLANLPANICTPTYLAKQAHILDTEWDTITTKALGKSSLEDLGMGAFLAVAKGSVEAPQLVQLKYHGAGFEPPVVLIGKGITFDSGGISLKPPEGMEEMKFDMAGAASVLGVLKACAALKLPINVVGLLACAENMPSGSATKPGDVVTSMAGLTIEITNTDAEGRLVLADALTYSKQFKPKYVVDIATLTGAMVMALGYVTTGFMTNDPELGEKIMEAGRQSQEKIWQMPLDSAYQDLLNSPIADMLNSPPTRVAGAITAACFLSRFAESFHWAHLDIAGTGWISGKNRCATGRPVALLIQLLRDLVHHAS